MEFFNDQQGNVGFRKIDFVVALLISRAFQKYHHQCIPNLKNILLPECQEDASFSSDWKEFVAPGIVHLLADCACKVMADIAKMEEALDNESTDVFFVLMIPADHRDAWLRILNALRLTLAYKYQLTHDEINGDVVTQIKTDRDEALVQMQILSIMQQHLINEELSE